MPASSAPNAMERPAVWVTAPAASTSSRVRAAKISDEWVAATAFISGRSANRPMPRISMVTATALRTLSPMASAISQRRAAQRRDQHQQRADRQILCHQDTERAAAETRVHLAPLRQQAQHDGGGGQRQGGADRDGGRNAEPGQDADASQNGRGRHHLQGAQHEHGPRQLPQARDRQLQADREQQEHDAQLRQRLGRVHVADEIEEGRADDQAGRQVSDDGAELQPLGQRCPDDRSRQDDKRIDENAEIFPVHPPPVAVLRDRAKPSIVRLYGMETRCAAGK